MRIAIIGGSGEFGRLFARLFRDEGHEVLITGRNPEKGAEVARELGVRFLGDNREAAAWSEVTVISVFIENTVEVIREVAPHLSPGSLLMDVTSVKVEPCRAMAEAAPEGVEIIGTHPMFGPRVRSIEGLTFILTPIRAERWEKFLLDFLERHKARVVITTPEEHDRIMSLVQGLTHFTYIATAATLEELEVDVPYSRKFASPIYELMLDLIARIVGQSPRLYASIQMHNPLVGRVHEAFLRQTETLKRIIEEKDVEAFRRVMISSARRMGDIDAAMGRSDKAIMALSGELKRLIRAKGKEVALRHIYSNALHVGRVEEVDPETVTIRTPRGKRIDLKLSNVELQNEETLQTWKVQNLPHFRRDFSYLFPMEAEAEVLKEVLESLDERILGVTLLDVYRGEQVPEGKKSVTLRVEAIDFQREDFERIESVLKGLGGLPR
jgi:prephenate dehydrogenase